jgi:hypothetical protein
MAIAGKEKRISNARARVGVPARALLDAYRQVLLCVFVATIFIIGLLALSAIRISLMPTVILAGALGAFFSSLMRLYRYEDLPKALVGGGLNLRSIYLYIYSLVPMVIGAIAAAVLYVVFASGYVEGTLFPKFACYKDHVCGTFKDFVQNYGPQPPDGFAKVLVWGFLSGFSERLVPDLLLRITNSSEAKKAS